MARLLIIGCSQRKRPDAGLLPAIDRYDGPPFRVLRKYFREHAQHDVSVVILSAEFGLIASDRPIPDYDRKMDRGRCTELMENASQRMRELLDQQSWGSVGACLSKDYLPAMFSEFKRSNLATLVWIKGGQGPRLSALLNWLHTAK